MPIDDPRRVIKKCRSFLLNIAKHSGHTTLPDMQLFPDDSSPDVQAVNPTTKALFVAEIQFTRHVENKLALALDHSRRAFETISTHIEAGVVRDFTFMLATDTPEHAEICSAQYELACVSLRLKDSAGQLIGFNVHYHEGIWYVFGSTDPLFFIERAY